MNYIEVEIGGKTRTLRFGLGMLGEMFDSLKTDIHGLGEMMSKNPFKAIPNIIYFGAKYEVERGGKVADFNLYDVNDWIEELENGYGNSVIDDITLVFMRSMIKNTPGMKEHLDSLPEEEKKRLIG